MMKKDLKNKIIEEVKMLEYFDDGVGINIGNNKGLFIQVVGYEEKEYLIELNDIDDNDVYEPCARYNAFSKFGDMENLIITIENYLEDVL